MCATQSAFEPVPGRVYRLESLRDGFGRGWQRRIRANLASNRLVRLARGLYTRPADSEFGPVPPRLDVLLDAVLDGDPYVVTGSTPWNALGLGSTAVFAVTLIYNRKWSREVRIGGRRIKFRRVRFPQTVTAEWFAVDLINNRAMAGLDLDTIRRLLPARIRTGVLDAGALRKAAAEYGKAATRRVIAEATAMQDTTRAG